MVADEHTTAPTSSTTYSSVVSIVSVRIEFLLATLNDLDTFVCDIVNTYLNAKYIEKLSTESVIYFGTEKGMVLIIPRALYGIKISGVVWRAKLAETVMLLG